MQCRAIPYEGNEPFVFFSYSHKDADRVYPILEQMVRDGFRVWYDDGNHAGDDWLENIGQHLNRCTVCLAMLSENSEQSHNCKKEVSFAVQCNKKLLAVMLEKFAMTIGMRLQLSTIHYLEKTDYPSNAALLNKLYESDCLRECRAAPGSIPMRSIPQEDRPIDTVPEKKSKVGAFIGSEIRQVKTDDSSAQEVPVAPPKEETPPIKKRSKLKVRAVQRVVHKGEEKPATNDTEGDESAALAEEEEKRETPTPENEQIAEDKKIVIQTETPPVDDTQEEPGKEIEPEEKTVYAGREERIQADSESATISAGENEDAVLIRLSSREVHFITSALTRLGRSKKRCDFEIKSNPSVSNHHADIVFYNDTYYLKDAGSSNGTFVGETRLNADQQTELPNMSIFRISDEPIMLVFGEAVASCKATKKIAFLINTNTQNAQVVGTNGINLDRSHKWADGTFSNSKVSREHAVIRYDDGEFVLEDLGSRNGTYLNDTKITAREPIVLQDKAQIRLADSVLEFGLISI